MVSLYMSAFVLMSLRMEYRNGLLFKGAYYRRTELVESEKMNRLLVSEVLACGFG
jgi:hypothetical protein